jgi:hypothetical protein
VGVITSNQKIKTKEEEKKRASRGKSGKSTGDRIPKENQRSKRRTTTVQPPREKVLRSLSGAAAVRVPSYCGFSTSSTTTLPPLSAVMTLCTGAYPVSEISIT